MINSRGIIQNNKTASDFIKDQKRYNDKYKIFSKDEEREFIEKHARLKLDEDGNIIMNDKFECEYEWIGDRTEVIHNLIMRNLQAVTKLTTKNCQYTRDYDDMYATARMGLVTAADLFHPFKIATDTLPSGKLVPKFDSNGKPIFIKFITFAQWYIFKGSRIEFQTKQVKIDNNSTSINELMRFHNSTNKIVTFENFLSDMISPDVEQPISDFEIVSHNETTDIMGDLNDYINNSNELSSIERGIIHEAFYNNSKRDVKFTTSYVKKLSKLFNVTQSIIVENQITAFNKVRTYLSDKHGITDFSDLF
jgi:hypothetical protein